jgi:hypothetical protein
MRAMDRTRKSTTGFGPIRRASRDAFGNDYDQGERR